MVLVENTPLHFFFRAAINHIFEQQLNPLGTLNSGNLWVLQMKMLALWIVRYLPINMDDDL